MIEVRTKADISCLSRSMMWMVGGLFVILVACGDDEIGVARGRGFGGGGRAPAAKAQAPSAAQTVQVAEKQKGVLYGDDDFVESERNRDPFRSYSILFKAEAPTVAQRKVVMPTVAIESMTLIAIISGVPKPKAMLKDPTGVGHVVERGMYIGRPQVVQASENVSMTLNWRVHRIRENEVVLTREDPTDPTRPALTRVIPLREEESLVKKFF